MQPTEEVTEAPAGQPALIPQQLTSTISTNPKNSQTLEMPLFWDLLNEKDKDEYNKMRVALSSPACKHRRHHSSELNREIVNTIKNFVIRNDGEDWRRALVSGIVWLPNAIAINTRQLRLLLSKCKSSINALFQNMGYVTIPTTNDYSSSLVQVFPLLKDNFNELRKWTIRLAASTQQQLKNQQQQNILHRQIPITNPISSQQVQPIQINQQIEPSENQTENTVESSITPHSDPTNDTDNPANFADKNLIKPELNNTVKKVEIITVLKNDSVPEPIKGE